MKWAVSGMDDKDCFGIIYKATNLINGKVYIGQTTNKLQVRKTSHINDSLAKRDNFVFHNAIRKHDRSNFKWEIVEYCDCKEELDEMEFHYIKQFNSSIPKGYNMTYGGGGMLGYKITEEHRKNLSESHKGYIHTAEQRKKIGEASLGRRHTEETKKRLSKQKLGSKNPMYGKCGKENPRYGISPPKHTIDALVEKISNVWLVIFPDGKEKVIKNLSKFCRDNNLNKGNLCGTAHGHRPHHKGFRCINLTNSGDL